MSAFDTVLYYSVSSGSFVQSVATPSSAPTPAWIYGDTKNLLVTFVKAASPAGTVAILTNVVTCLVGVGFLASLAGTVCTSGTATGPDANGAFACSLDLTTPAVQALIGQAAVIEFCTTVAGQSNRYQAPVRILPNLNNGNVPVNPPPDMPVGTAAAKCQFLMKDCAAGDFFIMRSQGGSAVRVWASDDYAVHFDPVNPTA
jgi:hypothetical protein